uniref:Leucine-rich repeat-containing protein 46 n=2 Tax=Rousettus aegyptiacus TaxID=9407 RepID=A0A7J8GB86_ROUAE|nr:leucine rich repeat containing 46 [Rousettus aegyptiacus]
MPGAELAQNPEEEGMCITEALITKRNLTFPEDEDLSEKMFHTLAELQTVRLDREGITTITNLEGLQNLHSLYLQENKIQRIENLACIPTLRFLSLAGNRIRQVENLRDLPHLQLLDLSENLIEKLKLDEFPQSLLILNLTGNSCTKQDSYRELVTRALPLLLDLDRQPVSERWNSDEEDEASDEEFPELSGPFCSERGERTTPTCSWTAGFERGGRSPWPGSLSASSLPQPRSSHLDGSGVAVRKWMHGCVGSWGRIDTMLAVVRKPPESIQMPLSLFLRMSIITSAVMPPAKEDRQLPPSLEAGLGSLHAHRLLGQGEDLSEVKSALAAPPALGLGMCPEVRVFGGDVRSDAQLVGDVAGPLCGGDGGLLIYH